MTFEEAKNTIQNFMKRGTTKLSAEMRNFLVVDNEAVRLYALEHSQDGQVELVEKKESFRAPKAIAQIKIAPDANLYLTLQEHGADFYQDIFCLRPKYFEKLWEVFTDLKLKSLKIQINRNATKMENICRRIGSLVVQNYELHGSVHQHGAEYNQLERKVSKLTERLNSQQRDLSSVSDYLKLRK